MIDAVDLRDKLGKKGFVDFVMNRQGRDMRQIDIERRRGRGRIKYRSCEHGHVLIDNYEATGFCSECHKKATGETKAFSPYFNFGTGKFYESKDEERGHLKQLEKEGAYCIGSQKV